MSFQDKIFRVIVSSFPFLPYIHKSFKNLVLKQTGLPSFDFTIFSSTFCSMYTDIVKKTPILSLLGDKDSIQEWGEGKYWGQFLLGMCCWPLITHYSLFCGQL